MKANERTEVKGVPGITVTVYLSPEDGVPVIYLDTENDLIPEGPLGPKMRVYVNDGDAYIGEPYPSDADHADLVKHDALELND